MRTLGQILCFALLAAGTARPVSAQMASPLVRMNCTSQNFPLCGWPYAFPESAFYRRSFVPSAGPSGQNVVQIDLIPSATEAQFPLGWSADVAQASQGAVRYVRFRLRPMTDYNRAIIPWTDKFVIVGDGDNPTGRVILDMGGHTQPHLQSSAARNIDGYPNRTQPWVTLPHGTWHSLQYELRSSSTTSSANGSLKIWQNAANSNYAVPTAQSGSFQLNAINWGHVGLGYFSNEAIPLGAQMSFQIAGFEYDDEFDPNWHQPGQSTPPPGMPTNVRVLREASLFVAPAVVGLVLLTRRRRDRPSSN